MDPFVTDAYVTTTYTVTATYGGCNSPATVTLYVTPPDFRELDLYLYLEGLYNAGTGYMREAMDTVPNPKFPGYADQISVELHNATTLEVDSALIFNNIMLGLDGKAVIDSLPGTTYGFYYIVVKHRNSIETWSGDSVDFRDPVPQTQYYFYTDAIAAYGANQRNMGSVYAIWSGDVNQDGVVDGSDLAQADNANSAILAGYFPEDVNGDGVVDGSDLALVDNNNAAIIQLMRP
jgi:hypothetical protein